MRAVSLSNTRIISLLNSSYVPVYATNEDYRDNGSAPAAEKAELRRIQKEGYEKKLSVGSVHAFVIGPDGHMLDSMHTVDVAKPEKLITMLERAVTTLGTKPGAPVVQPRPQPAPTCEPGGLTLHLTARYLERRGAEYALVVDAGGNWSALPSEDWILLSKEEAAKLLPPGTPKVGASWTVDEGLASNLLLHFYPPSENSDIGKNKIESQSLKATVISSEPGKVRARLEGSLKMKHHFYHKEDGRWVEASVVGYLDFNPATRKIARLQLVTEDAGYFYPEGKRSDPFGVAVRSLP